jgi:hypothetical protein
LAATVNQSTKNSKQRSIRPSVLPAAVNLSAEHGVLVSQDQQLDLIVARCTRHKDRIGH